MSVRWSRRGRRSASRARALTMLVLALVGAATIYRGSIGELGRPTPKVPLKTRTGHVESARQFTPKAVVTAGTRAGHAKVVVAMVDNSPAARPQFGLMQASVVVEALAEGGVPRYMAVFARDATDTKVGPIRSARPYFVERAMEYEGGYVHCGGSPQALSLLSSQSRVTDIDELKGAGGFFRSSTRRAPHNLFTTLKASRRSALRTQTSDPLEQSFHISKAGALWGDDSNECTVATIRMSRDHTVSYRYDRESGAMMRMVNGKADLDASSGRQLSCITLVVQFARHRTLDEVGRLAIDMVGEGSGLVITRGQVFSCIWRKPDAGSPTVYYRGKSVVEIARGCVWVEVVAQGSAVLEDDGGA